MNEQQLDQYLAARREGLWYVTAGLVAAIFLIGAALIGAYPYHF